MQSRLFTELPDGRPRELGILEKHGNESHKVMYRGKLHNGDVLRVLRAGFSGATNSSSKRTAELSKLEKTNFQIKILDVIGNGIAEVEAINSQNKQVDINELTKKYGSVPLPPYLHRDASKDDIKRYQIIE